MKSIIVIVALIAALAAGCGSGASAKTVTVSTAMTSTLPSVSEPPAPDPRIANLQLFLIEFKPLRARVTAVNTEIRQAVTTYNATSHSTADIEQLGNATGAAAAKLTPITNKLATINPPSSVRAAFTRYVDSLSENQTLLSSGAADAKNGDLTSLNQAATQFNTAGSAHLKTVLIMQLSALGMHVPGWVKAIGD